MLSQYKLFDHQALGLEYMRAREGVALFHDQGLGKTLPTLVRLLELKQTGEIENALVVAPKPVMGAWERDIEKFFTPASRKTLEGLISLINYESVWRPGKGYDKQWGAIVLDESQKIKSRTSKVTKFLLELAPHAKYRYILTGTPIGNGRMEDIWTQFTFLYPKKKGRWMTSEIFGSYTAFTDRYCLLDRYWKPYRYFHVDELQEIISNNSHRVKKEEALDLPEKLPDQVWEFDLKERKLYKELHRTNVAREYDLLVDNPLVRMDKLRQICSGFLTLEDGSKTPLKTEKYKVLGEYLDDRDDKLVIFAHYRRSIELIEELLERKKIEYRTLDGRTVDKTGAWKEFQADEKIQVIVCQYQSGATGIDLYAADTIIYFEPTLSSTILEQSRDRIHRVGQTRPCSYIHFITKGTVEAAIYKSLEGFGNFTEKLFTEYMYQYQRRWGVR